MGTCESRDSRNNEWEHLGRVTVGRMNGNICDHVKSGRMNGNI